MFVLVSIGMWLIVFLRIGLKWLKFLGNWLNLKLLGMLFIVQGLVLGLKVLSSILFVFFL